MSGSFMWRVLALCVFAALMLLRDLGEPPGERHRWREYAVLFLCAALGGALGVAIDSLTVRISAEYFEHGKGIPRGAGFESAVLLLGAQAGISAGVVVSAMLLVANRQAKFALSCLTQVPLLIVGALVGGAALGCSQWAWAWFPVDNVPLVLEGDAARRFGVVWVTHLGVYLGGAFGTVLGIYRVVRKRRARLSGVEQ